MNILQNIIGGLKQKNNLMTLGILFFLGTTWIHSQNTLHTKISYDKLQEVAKYVAYKDSTTNIFTKYRNELKLKDSIIHTKNLRITYKDSTISTLNKINAKSNIQIVKTNGLLEISELMYKEERRKKWRWGVVGILSGILTGFLLAYTI